MRSDYWSVPVDMDQEEVAVLFRRYGMISVGVVDLYNRLFGMITMDDVIDMIDEEAEEDLMALAGVGEANLRLSIIETMKGRTTWLLVALLNGFAFAGLASLVSYVWFGYLEIAMVMAVAMLANFLVAGLSGTLIPLGLLRSGVDPAVASSVSVTTITDVVGFFIFLGLAALYLI